MLFNFQSFISDLRENPEKKDAIEKYEKFFGEITWDIKDQKWYKEYIQQFETVEYNVPEEIKDDFDRDLLMQLVAGSFSSEWTMDVENNQIEFIVTVQSWEQVVVKKISELWWFQVLRLFEIYIEEQINLEVLMAEDENEKESIESQRDARINRWQVVMDNIKHKHEQEKEEQEKQEKLEDLKNKL